MKSVAVIFTALALASGLAHAGEHEVSQKNRTFSAKSLKIKAGDSVNFKNDDTVSHNIFSLSDAKTFDTGAYAGGQAKKVTFEKAGNVEIECAIHPDMKMLIEVEK
jgi:plastocyanin